MRLTYGANQRLGYRGDIITKERVKAAPAKENILFGSAVGYVGTDYKLGFQNPSPNKILAAGAIVASNVINGNVTVKTFDSSGNEVITTEAIAPVTYATGNDETWLLIKAAIEALDSNLTATIDVTPTTRGITVTHADNAVVLLDTWVVTLGGGQTTFSYSFDGTILGCAPRAPIEQNSDGTVYYKPGMKVGVLTKGIMTIYSEDIMTNASSIAVQHMVNGAIARGEIRTTTDSGKATAFTTLKPLDSVAADSLANVEINAP
jgi:hypothetical protein